MQITGAMDIEENPDNCALSQWTNLPRAIEAQKGGGNPATPMQGVPFQESRGRSIKDFLPGKECKQEASRRIKEVPPHNCVSGKWGYEVCYVV